MNISEKNFPGGKVWNFPNGQIRLISGEYWCIELTGDFISTLRVALYPEAVEALREVLKEIEPAKS